MAAACSVLMHTALNHTTAVSWHGSNLETCAWHNRNAEDDS